MPTEEEAKALWCPMSRQSEQGVGGSYNRPTSGGFNCIASGCMMWRQTNGEYDTFERIENLKKPPGEVNPPFSNCPEGYTVASYGHSSYTAARKTGTKPATGLCGLAGPAY